MPAAGQMAVYTDVCCLMLGACELRHVASRLHASTWTRSLRNNPLFLVAHNIAAHPVYLQLLLVLAAAATAAVSGHARTS